MPDEKVSKCTKQKLTNVKREIGKSAVTIGDFQDPPRPSHW